MASDDDDSDDSGGIYFSNGGGVSLSIYHKWNKYIIINIIIDNTIFSIPAWRWNKWGWVSSVSSSSLAQNFPRNPCDFHFFFLSLPLEHRQSQSFLKYFTIQ